MSKRDLIHRGFNNWEAYFWHIMIKARSEDPHSLLDMFNDLLPKQQVHCMCFLAFISHAPHSDAADANSAMDIIYRHVNP